MATNEPLCSFCETVPLNVELLQDLFHMKDQTFVVGTWEHIQTSPCPLCRLLKLAAFDDNRTTTKERKKFEGPVELWWSNSWGAIGMGGFIVRGLTEAHICFATPPGEGNNYNEAYCLKPFVPAEIDMRVVSEWITECESNHDERCNPPRTRRFQDVFPGLSVMRFIDVFRGCLVETTDLEQYVALSYVWGNVNNFRLTTTNRQKLLQPGSITQAKIPTTIGDAISLTKKLGVRYLWVDALCLIQNDPMDLEQGVTVMDKVYESSWLTVIAACGHDANAGLPGVEPETRYPPSNVLEMKPGVYLGLFTHRDQLMRGTVYHSRAWTFQEDVLCRRALYFVDNKLFYQCSSKAHAESAWMRRAPVNGTFESAASLLPNAVELQVPLDDFAIMLLYYTERALTNQNDVLRAMAGVIRRITELVKYRFLEGLPTAGIDAFVAFRANLSILHRRLGHPSYSWTGWKGPIIYWRDQEAEQWLANDTWIIWYKRSPSGVTNLVWDLAANESCDINHWSYGGYRDRRPFVSPVPLTHPTTRTAPSEDIVIEGPVPTYPLLQFWTLAVSFKLIEVDVFRCTCKLQGSDGNICGTMDMDGLEETTFFDSVYPFEMILLSTDVDKDDRRRPVYNIMILEWNGGFAERRGLGGLHRDKVGMSFTEPRWKEIILG